MRDRLGHGAGEHAQCGAAGARRAQLFAQLDLLAREPLRLRGLARMTSASTASARQPANTAWVRPSSSARAAASRASPSLLPVALAHGITTETAATVTLTAIDRDAQDFPDHAVLWPLLVGAWKRKESSA